MCVTLLDFNENQNPTLHSPTNAHNVKKRRMCTAHTPHRVSPILYHICLSVLIACILLIYTLHKYRFITVIICSHNIDNVLYELYLSILNEVYNFS